MRTVLAFLVVLLASGCSRPITEASGPAAMASPAAASPARQGARSPSPEPRRAPPMSDPLPPEPVAGGTRLAPGTSCRTDTDCAVKDAGSCCGVNPTCMNKDAPVDPAAVKARCEKEGRVSTCAFKPIESCSCVAGSCKANLMMTH